MNRPKRSCRNTYKNKENEKPIALDDLPTDSSSDESIAPRKRKTPISRKSKESNASEILRPAVRKNTPVKKGTKKYDPLKWHPKLQAVWETIDEDASLPKNIRRDQPEKLVCKLLPFQLEALDWMSRQELSRIKGGILADEMGMGKTLEVISLLVTSPETPTLIVVPSVAILQWIAEFQNMVKPGVMDTYMYYGNNRVLDANEISKHGVVVTTYSTLEQGYRSYKYGRIRKGEKVYVPSPLHEVEWARVVLDEAHLIKDRYTSTAASAYALKKKYRWCLTGTPLQNRIGELYSLIKFIDAYPYSTYFCRWCPCELEKWDFQGTVWCKWCNHHAGGHSAWMNHEVIRLIQKNGTDGDGLISLDRLRQILGAVMLRRTKIERLDDLMLPPRMVQVRRDYFSEAESEVYRSLFSDCVRKYHYYVSGEESLNKYTSIFSLLSRMRLSVNHPDLVTSKMIIKPESNDNNFICSLCNDEADDPIISKCKHIFCRLEVKEYVMLGQPGSILPCPKCFKPFSIDLTQKAISRSDLDSASLKERPISIIDNINLKTWRSSTKIEALVEELTNLQKENATLKSIVFSQFVSFLDLVQWRLSRSGFNVVRLDGKMGPFERNVVIKKFMTDPTVTVFLMSLKAGGVALNLTEASHVFIMDPWWNPAVENQAFDRIHRIGQCRPVEIKRLIIEDSIESRIVELQEKKQSMFASTVGKDNEALERLTKEDLAFLFSVN